MKTARLFTRKKLLLFWFGCGLLFVMTQTIGLFKVPSYVDQGFVQVIPVRRRSSIELIVQSSLKALDAKNVTAEVVCAIPWDPVFPLCDFKIKELNEKWNPKCHGEKYKVDLKNTCSVIQYLSEKEAWCPLLSWRQHQNSPTFRKDPNISLAIIQTNVSGLLEKISGERYAWIRKRIIGTWSHWVEAVEELRPKLDANMRRRKKILLYLSSMGEHKFFLDNAFMGGPLGELTQWCDLISALYVLGHDVTIGFNVDDVPSSLVHPAQDGCVREASTDGLDLIFTDIMGLMILAMRSGPDYSLHKCKIRVLDSFGTDAEFNYKKYKGKIPGGRSPWGDLDLHLQQFMTMYPHSPDNSFLGFAVPQRKQKDKDENTRKAALVYGKDPAFWKGYGDYIGTMKKHFDEVHSTLGGTKESHRKYQVPEYVINHGIVNITTLIGLFESSKVFVGLGKPYEGPAALEALANGCFFLNPKFNPPLDRTNTGFFAGKPFNRKITSQNPYAEVFVGKPFVHTVDINNLTEVEEALRQIINTKDEPHLPYEFTHLGMLERVSAYVENQEFCKLSHWPPLRELQMVLGGEGEACIEACHKKQLMCEPKYFTSLNTKESLERTDLQCKSIVFLQSLLAPAFHSADGGCWLQSQPLLFSCRAAGPGVQRLCPCRSYRKEQVALCTSC
ncbi:PREDICTED: alpha-1,6-mannosylglycoprotein 6-beta-N-acetylglucosaminyltransferase A-like [Acropora digitifera]|uniref:alpha-1,6-mannosylglycoprotein 6-beta-N-acetylglucosaminyltransferase A-like n=1 Tax=Acropora digitifera TaxID=70779 RepID=UPI00077A71DE|nr:PREDICTED: alpha-1,6-mannosylglycoprotein 6-beta-N-acetylglucosaminyltransferase A-like [Acropora digitifera]